MNSHNIGTLDHKNLADDAEKREKRFARNKRRLEEGKSTRPLYNVGTSLESDLIHEYGHSVDFTYGISEDQRMIDFFNKFSESEREEQVSTYGSGICC